MIKTTSYKYIDLKERIDRLETTNTQLENEVAYLHNSIDELCEEGYVLKIDNV